jgi:hypothetical protein
MKKILFLILLLAFTFSCSKKKKEELTPLNAPAKYGETMGRAMKKAKAMDEILYLEK